MADEKQIPKRVTTRKMYKDVKKFNHIQFENFCESLYAQGYKNGRDSVPGVDLKKVMEAIGTVKGIGAKRMEEIGKAVEKLFPEEPKEEAGKE